MQPFEVGSAARCFPGLLDFSLHTALLLPQLITAFCRFPLSPGCLVQPSPQAGSFVLRLCCCFHRRLALVLQVPDFTFVLAQVALQLHQPFFRQPGLTAAAAVFRL